MDAATLYTIVTMLDGRDRIFSRRFSSVTECEARLAQMNSYRVRGMPTRYSCERHIRISPADRTED